MAIELQFVSQLHSTTKMIDRNLESIGSNEFLELGNRVTPEDIAISFHIPPLGDISTDRILSPYILVGFHHQYGYRSHEVELMAKKGQIGHAMPICRLLLCTKV